VRLQGRSPAGKYQRLSSDVILFQVDRTFDLFLYQFVIECVLVFWCSVCFHCNVRRIAIEHTMLGEAYDNNALSRTYQFSYRIIQALKRDQELPSRYCDGVRA
jgi:hypothetical protein